MKTANTVNPRLSTVALIQTFLTWRLFEVGAYLNENQRFQVYDFFFVRELIFLHSRPYLLSRQNQVSGLYTFSNRIHSPGMDQFQVF